MYRIGIDLGGTNIAAGLVNDKGELIYKKSIPTLAKRSEDAIIADMANVAKDVVLESGKTMDDISSIGIGAPGAVDSEAGIVLSACNLNFFNTPLVEKFKKHIVKPVYIDNDANCAAWGEAKAGISKKTKNSVMITLGTGVGGGIIADGKLLRGFNSFAAELGHMTIVADGRECSCGRKGCWEAYSSATALIKITKEFANEDKNSYIWQVVKKEGKFSGITPFEAAKTGDKTAQKVIDYYIKHLAIGIFNLVMIFQPEIVVVGGGVCNQGDNLLLPLEKLVNEMAYSNQNIVEKKRTKIKKALLGSEAGVIGAALLGDSKA